MDLNLNSLPLFPLDLKDVSALWNLGLITIGDVQDLASQMLAEGADVDQLVRVLVPPRDDVESIKNEFDHFLEEKGVRMVDGRDALRHLAKTISASIVRRNIAPFDGAVFLWDAVLKSKDRDFHELDSFIYAASEMRDRPADRSFFEDAILEEATSWANGNNAKAD